MAIKLTTKQTEVIRKIIYAVESGGQVYGKQNYSAFIGAGHNTSNEVAITIGAGQWYGTEAKLLLNIIRGKNEAMFKKLDTAGIAVDLDNEDWSKYSISPTSNKAKCIINIISSANGIAGQDELMDRQINLYSETIQNMYGDMTADTVAECINIKHQGGDGALKRILSKCSKPYSAKKIKAALDLDPKDKSNNNQVGDYVTRQNKVYEMIVKYLMPEVQNDTIIDKIKDNVNDAIDKIIGGNSMTEKELRSKVANWLVPYVGISEGSANHLKILAIFNDSKLCTRYKMTKKDAWCATSVSSVFINLGLAGAAGSGKLFECVECSCGHMIQHAQKQGIWVENDSYVPKIGDVVMYDWDDSGKGDDTGWPEHVGIVISVSGNTFRVIEGNIRNSVGYRNMTVNAKFIRGFIAPNYAKFAKTTVTESNNKPSTESSSKPTTSTTTLNKTCKFEGTVTASTLNVRDWAGSKGTNILRTLSKGTKVEVCDTIQDKDGNDWYYIKESSKYGFVSADYIAKIEVAKPAGLNRTCKFEGTVTASKLNVRSWAGTEYDKLRALDKGTKVEVCDEVKATTGKIWYYIKESNKYGFVSADYIARV